MRSIYIELYREFWRRALTPLRDGDGNIFIGRSGEKKRYTNTQQKKTTPANRSLTEFSIHFYLNFQCNKYGEQISIELIQKILM